MNIALTKHFEELIARLVASGRYNNSSEVVRAGLRILDAEEKSLAAGIVSAGLAAPPLHQGRQSSRASHLRASTLKAEAE